MKIKMRTILAGPMGNMQPGQVVDVPDDTARTLIDGGFAEAVDVPSPVETEHVPSENHTVIEWLMSLTLKKLREMAAEMEIKGNAENARATKTELAEALAAAGVSAPSPDDDDNDTTKPIETASMGGGERTANTAEPRRRTPSA